MNVGIFVFQTNTSVDSAVLARHAEDLGFESYWVPEHAILPVHATSRFPGTADGVVPDEYGRIFDPFIALARASAVTRTIKLGSGICLVPEHNPLHLAKVISSLDQASGGRFLFGVGTGWHKEETEIMGGDFAHRWTQARDAVLAMKALWTQDEAEYRGAYYDFPAVRSVPKPAAEAPPARHPGRQGAERLEAGGRMGRRLAAVSHLGRRNPAQPQHHRRAGRSGRA